MTVKVFGIDNSRVHLWNYENFKEAHNAKVVGKSLDGNLIRYILYKIMCEIDKEVLNENGLDYSIEEN